MFCRNCVSWYVILILTLQEVIGADDDYNTLHKDGSFEFGYNNPDSYHFADGNRNNVVRGEFGGRNPGTGAIDSTVYTAGPRGYRPRGKNVARKYDLNQNGPRPVGSRDDPYYDPFEDPSYNFSFRTRTYNREENANRVGDVNGRYSYVDDVGERHNVEFIAGKNTGFHVKTPFPDSNPRAYGPLYFNGRGRPIPRGRTSIQRGTDGSYRFVSAGPDQRRTEVSDATGHVRGSYTYLDDKGVQHSVHYIAGPETGYRVLKQVKGPHLPTVFPFGRPEIIPPDFYDVPKDTGDVFDTAASGHFRPGAGKPSSKPTGGAKDETFGNDIEKDDFDLDSTKPFGGSRPGGSRPGGSRPGGSRPGGSRPSSSRPGGSEKPSYIDEDSGDFGDLFGGTNGGAGTGSGTTGSGTTGSGITGGGSSTTSRPSIGGGYKPSISSTEDDGSYKPSGDDGLYNPSSTAGYGGSTTTRRPSYGGITTSRPTGPSRPDSSEVGYESGPKPIPSFEERPTGLPSSTNRPGARPNYDGGRPGGSSRPGGGSRPGGSSRPGGKPSYDDYSSNEVGDNFGLFGSETARPRPPFPSVSSGSGQTSDGPIVNIGITNDCARCQGTLVTNVGDRIFSVPPGLSVRAHVQAIDLLAVNPSVPSPSEQYKADLDRKTEQLNASEDDIVSRSGSEDIDDEEDETTTTFPTTSTTITTTEIPTANTTSRS